MKYSKTLLVVVFSLVLLGFAMANDFNPRGNINLRSLYNITNWSIGNCSEGYAMNGIWTANGSIRCNQVSTAGFDFSANFDQDVNTTSDVQFNSVDISSAPSACSNANYFTTYWNGSTQTCTKINYAFPYMNVSGGIIAGGNINVTDYNISAHSLKLWPRNQTATDWPAIHLFGLNTGDSSGATERSEISFWAVENGSAANKRALSIQAHSNGSTQPREVSFYSALRDGDWGSKVFEWSYGENATGEFEWIYVNRFNVFLQYWPGFYNNMTEDDENFGGWDISGRHWDWTLDDDDSLFGVTFQWRENGNRVLTELNHVGMDFNLTYLNVSGNISVDTIKVLGANQTGIDFTPAVHLYGYGTSKDAELSFWGTGSEEVLNDDANNRYLSIQTVGNTSTTNTHVKFFCPLKNNTWGMTCLDIPVGLGNNATMGFGYIQRLEFSRDFWDGYYSTLDADTGIHAGLDVYDAEFDITLDENDNKWGAWFALFENGRKNNKLLEVNHENMDINLTLNVSENILTQKGGYIKVNDADGESFDTGMITIKHHDIDNIYGVHIDSENVSYNAMYFNYRGADYGLGIDVSGIENAAGGIFVDTHINGSEGIFSQVRNGSDSYGMRINNMGLNESIFIDHKWANTSYNHSAILIRRGAIQFNDDGVNYGDVLNRNFIFMGGRKDANDGGEGKAETFAIGTSYYGSGNSAKLWIRSDFDFDNVNPNRIPDNSSLINIFGVSGAGAEVNGTFQASDYYSGDGTQGDTDTSSWWMCVDSDCNATCQVSVKDGLITGCS